jgi:signal transduction histidine kinase/CheY-like chemotaxis protein/PAS domain-containing protein
MLKKLNNLISKCIFSDKIPLEGRILNLLLYFGMVTAVFSGVLRFLLGNSPLSGALFMIVAVSAVALLVLANKSGKYRLYTWAAVIAVCDIQFPLMFFVNGGIESSMASYFVIGIVLICLVLRGKELLVMLLINMTIVLSLYIIEWNFPHLIIPFDRQFQQYADEIQSVLVAGLFLGAVIKYQNFVYHKEKQRAEEATRAKEENIRYRERLLADIERSEETRRSMFQNNPYMCVMYDSAFQVIDCNPAALEFFGFAGLDEFKRDFLPFLAAAIPERQPNGQESSSLQDQLAIAARDGSNEFETVLLLNNAPCPISAIMKKVDYMDSFAIMAYFIDQRRQREMRVALARRDRLLSTLNTMAVILMSSGKDIAALLHDAIAELGKGVDADIAYILENTEVNGELCCSCDIFWARVKPEPPVNVPYDRFAPPWRETLAKGVILNARFSDIFERPEDIHPSIAFAKAYANIPLFINGVFWGAVGLLRVSNDSFFIKAEEDLLQSAGTLIASAIIRDGMTKDLLEANRAATAGAQAKTDFLSRMSHEIRTPMNTIIGMTTLGQKASGMDRIKYCLKQIENSSRQLLGIINDVLDMSKIEANKLEILSEEFEFEDMIQHVINVVQVKMDEKAQEFLVNIENVFPRTVISDELRLSQVLINLLTNAVKFTPDGGTITLFVRETAIDADTARLHIEVADTGIGITDEQKARLFRVFEQAESTTTRKYGGTGLGLSISKSIVNLMGGDIWVEDNPDGGSKFVFEVIITWGGARRPKNMPAALRRGPAGGLRILVVDDDPPTLEYIESILESFSLACDKAGSGAQAVAMAKKCAEEGGSYDMVFLDWKMPDMDGRETAAEIKRIIGKNPIIVMISSASHDEVISALNPVGVTHFLPKPVLPSALFNTIITLMGYENEAAAEKGTPSYDWSGRRLLLAEDVEINREVLMGILEETGITIEYAENGRRAVQMFAGHEYDIILMDIQMPVMDGFDATRAIRSLEAEQPSKSVKPIPIIAMTANAFKEDVRECLAAGMNGHVAKPIDVRQLYSTLAAYLPPEPPGPQNR